jgi:branched-chain amino acid transport system ATP-binding protein
MQLQKPGIMPSGLVRHSKDNGWNLKVNHLTVNFNGVTAINDVSFSVEPAGCIIGLIGPNGAGKTTLFNCIAGENQQFAGSISFPGMKGRHSPFMSARCGVGRTFQTPQLFESMTAFENIAVSSIAQSDIPIIGSLCGTMRWTSFSNKEKEKVNEIVRYLGLTEVANMKVNSLPLAMQRLIEIGRALALKPRVILLDEIASGLNSSDKNQLSEIIRQLCKQTSVGFLIVEHDMDFIMPLAEEILVIDAGEMIFRGSPSEVKANQGVIDAYLGGTNVIP